MSSDSDNNSNPFSPTLSDQSSKNLDDSKDEKSINQEIKKEPIDEEMNESLNKNDEKIDKSNKKELINYKDEDNDVGFSNSFLEAKVAAFKTKNQLETEDRERMQLVFFLN